MLQMTASSQSAQPQIGIDYRKLSENSGVNIELVNPQLTVSRQSNSKNEQNSTKSSKTQKSAGKGRSSSHNLVTNTIELAASQPNDSQNTKTNHNNNGKTTSKTLSRSHDSRSYHHAQRTCTLATSLLTHNNLTRSNSSFARISKDKEGARDDTKAHKAIRRSNSSKPTRAKSSKQKKTAEGQAPKVTLPAVPWPAATKAQAVPGDTNFGSAVKTLLAVKRTVTMWRLATRKNSLNNNNNSPSTSTPSKYLAHQKEPPSTLGAGQNAQLSIVLHARIGDAPKTKTILNSDQETT